MVSLEKVKLYLRIDTDFEDEIIEHFMTAADSYLIDAVTDFKIHYETDTNYEAKADLLKMILVGEMFNNRDGRNDPRQDYSFCVRSMINQLNYYAEESEVKSDEDSGQSDNTDNT